MEQNENQDSIRERIRAYAFDLKLPLVQMCIIDRYYNADKEYRNAGKSERNDHSHTCDTFLRMYHVH